MKISKSIFKQYTRCNRFAALDDLYYHKLGLDKSKFTDDEKEELIELLGTMFDSESGDDFIDVVDVQMQALLPYYNALESYAMKIAEEKYGFGIIHNKETKKQKLFNFFDGKYEFFCYLDGFQETDEVIRIFEVKATSAKKFRELGPKVKGVQKSIFSDIDNVLRLETKPDFDIKKFNDYYAKLFDRFSDVGHYTFDIAIERYIIENSIKQNNLYKNKKIEYYLVVLDNEYVFDGTYDEENNMVYNKDNNGRELVTFIDMSDISEAYQTKISDLKKLLIENIETLDHSHIKLGRQCERKNQTKCPFVMTCWKEALQDGSILEYLDNHNGFYDENGIKHEVFDLLEQGLNRIDSIPKKWLRKPNNIIQRECFDENKEYFNLEKIKAGIRSIVYPIYHLDFESFPSPLPRFRGEKPYAQSVFQFSLHVERKMGECDKQKDHLEYLAKDNNDHRLDLIKEMIKDIDLKNGGTVLVYNKSFEHTRIKEFSQMFPEYKKELDKINEHIFDLIDIVKTNSNFYKELGFSEEESKEVNFYNNNLHGSYSIKKVLPIFSSLTYKGMKIGKGTEAIAAYASYKSLNEEDLEKLQKDLVRYCQQDTWAMVVVLWELIKKVGLFNAN